LEIFNNALRPAGDASGGSAIPSRRRQGPGEPVADLAGQRRYFLEMSGHFGSSLALGFGYPLLVVAKMVFVMPMPVFQALDQFFGKGHRRRRMGGMRMIVPVAVLMVRMGMIVVVRMGGVVMGVPLLVGIVHRFPPSAGFSKRR
jgi:hypothetical protein